MHLLFFLFFDFIPILNLRCLSMIKDGKFQPRMSWMQLDTNVTFLQLQLRGFFSQVKNVQNNGKSVKQHFLQKKNQKLFFKNYLNIFIIQIFRHVIPHFQAMIFYFKAKKKFLIYLYPTRHKSRAAPRHATLAAPRDIFQLHKNKVYEFFSTFLFNFY